MENIISGILAKLASDYGYGVITSIVIILLFWKTLQWNIRQIESLNKQSLEREKNLLEIIRGHEEALQQHTLLLQKFYDNITNANEFQRKEHDYIIRKLEAICNMVQERR